MRNSMKKAGLLIMTILAAFSLTGCDACKDNILTGLGDKIAAIGKDDMAKNEVLVERKAARASKCAEQKGAEMKKKMGL